MKNNFKKIYIFLLIFTNIIIFCSCKKFEYIKTNDIDTTKTKIIANKIFEVYEDGNWNGEEVYILSPEIQAQNLSIVVKTIQNKLIVFDGGRKEDADFLTNFILENGGRVDSWFLTHSHDDHAGAIFEIFDKYKNKIFVENIYYKFPPFEWAYRLIGNDAGAIPLIENKILEYQNYKNSEKNIDENDGENINRNFDENIKEEKEEIGNNNFVKIHNDIHMNDLYDIDGVNVRIMNDMYMIDEDPINNSSIAYKVTIGDKSIMILGDLSYDGGIKLINDNSDNMESDFVVMAHHGQGGVGKEVYDIIKPKYAIWCTTNKIYDNIDNKYSTNTTKEWMKLLGVKRNYVTISKNFLIK